MLLGTTMGPAIAIGANIYRHRKDARLKKSLVESVAANPAFEPLSDEPRFKHIVEGLREVTQ
jgi:hypothetical protein